MIKIDKKIKSNAVCGTAGTAGKEISGGKITNWTVNLNVDAIDYTSILSLKDFCFTFDSLTANTKSLNAIKKI